MAVTAEVEQTLASKFAAVFAHLDERQRRLAMAAEARALGRGSITTVARAGGVSAVTVSKGVAEPEVARLPKTMEQYPSRAEASLRTLALGLADMDSMVDAL